MNRAGRRYYRTIILALLAMAALVWVAMDQFGISRQDFTELLIGTVLAVLLVIILAGTVVALGLGLRRLLRGNRD